MGIPHRSFYVWGSILEVDPKMPFAVDRPILLCLRVLMPALQVWLHHEIAELCFQPIRLSSQALSPALPGHGRFRADIRRTYQRLRVDSHEVHVYRVDIP